MQRKEYTKKRAVRDASKLRVGVVVSRFNEDITDLMLTGALETLHKWGVKEANTHIVRVPGAFEIPLACLKLIKRQKLDAVITIGCIIKGETEHDRYLATAVSGGLMRLSLDHALPISFGVITTNNLAQAKARSQGKTNKGIEAANAALDMALL
ncbi:6,7-dimethyl-8-ribityllumazine synthase [Candidatus Kaiserbacteria bacterium]|nr:6,7-dimethyl-8-ribityllumazine synthase [Candidatus Kaiserbacteria bacterium]